MAGPATIGRYRILAELGRGGMGVVYRAHDPVIEREVALKTIRNVEGIPPEVFEELRQRFLLEARAAGRLAHPGIVGVLDAGTDESSGISFIAMELVQGRDLETFLREGVRFTPERAGLLAASVADALAAAHQRGIVHRDIKPANILLDDGGRVRVTDFGIASVADAGLTRTGQILGSPAYMSPEQISGRAVDGRSDIFALGAVLYELLTGRRAFPGEGLSTLTFQIVHGTPELLHALPPAVQAAYQAVVDRALAKTPEARFPDAGSLASELRRLAAGESPRVGPTATVTDLAAPDPPRASSGTVIDAPAASPAAVARRAPWKLGAAGLALLTFAGIAWWVMTPAADAPQPVPATSAPARRSTPRPVASARTSRPPERTPAPTAEPTRPDKSRKPDHPGRGKKKDRGR